MAKVKTSENPPKNQVIGGNLIVGVPGGPTILQRSNNNRPNVGRSPRHHGKGPAPGFGSLDQTISNLDATYDHLPNQAEWELYAANIVGEWSLCANCQTGTGGKKLFRQYNYNRLLTQRLVVTSPLDNTEFSDVAYLNATLTTGGGLNVTSIGWNTLYPNYPGYVIPTGPFKAQGPVLDQNSLTAGTYAPNTPVGEWCIQCFNATYAAPTTGPGTGYTFTICQWKNSGAPGLQTYCDFVFA